jgi:hypothetical protein
MNKTRASSSSPIGRAPASLAFSVAPAATSDILARTSRATPRAEAREKDTSVGEKEAFCFLVKKNTLAPSVHLIDIRLFARFLAAREKPPAKFFSAFRRFRGTLPVCVGGCGGFTNRNFLSPTGHRQG